MDGGRDLDAGQPVLAILPFAAAGDDGFIAAGLHEDICGELTRFRSLRVISPASAAVVADRSDPEIAERLGASHVMRGRLRRAGDRLQLSATLSDARSATQLWSERIVMPADDPQALEQTVLARIAATLNARLEEAALAGARRRPAASLAAYELTLRGMALLREATLEADETARALFEQAIAIDPLYPRAHSGLALSWFNEWSCQFWDRFEEASRRAYQHAYRALELDDSDAMVHLVIAKVALFRRAWEQAAWYVDRALAFCPNDAELLVQASVLEVYLGRPEAAVEHVDRAMRLNPYHPNHYFALAAFARVFAGDLEGALEFRARSDAMPFVDAPAYCAFAAAHLGRMDEARAELERYHGEYRAKIAFGSEVAPGAPTAWLFDLNPFRRPEDIAFLSEGFRLLGAAPEAPRAEPRTGVESARLAPMGDGWIAEFGGTRAILPDLKGLHDIRRLLERSGEEVHCLDLAEREAEGPGDAVLDEKARAALRSRIRDLQEELAEAEDMNDLGRTERLRAEMDALVETLSRALGLGGRGRRLGDLSEKARTAVTWRIRHALRRIEAAHPALGRHLANALRTGTFCLYRPEAPVAWRFEAA
jgi:TolB-like protein/Tfp pilus assembly protein PilF